MSKVRSDGGKNNPYITRNCLNAIKVKHRKWQKFKHCSTEQNYEIYKIARNTVTAELRKAKYIYEKDLSVKIKSENKLLWSYVRSKTKTKSEVSRLENAEN